MKLLGVGLSKTGTTSLHRALQMLGLSSLHYDQQRLNDILDGTTGNPDFRRYDDVDAVLDIPSAVFFQELLDAYPACRCILTVRDELQWWKSIEFHFNRKSPVRRREDDPFKWRVRHLTYGSAAAGEVMFRRRYREHNDRVLRTVPADRLLVMDIAAGDGWETLCPFLNVPIPDLPFPHTNRRDHADNASPGRMHAELLTLIPPGHRFIWVDGCELPAPDVADRVAVPFLETGGEYAGPPADSLEAIAACERLRTEGADWIVFAWSAFWWLDFYRDFNEYLHASFPCIARHDRLIAFDLRTPLRTAANRLLVLGIPPAPSGGEV